MSNVHSTSKLKSTVYIRQLVELGSSGYSIHIHRPMPNCNVQIPKLTRFDFCISSMRPSREDCHLYHGIGTETPTGYSSILNRNKYGSNIVSYNCGLNNVALTLSVISPAMKICSDIVSVDSSGDKCGPGNCGPDKCCPDKTRFDMVLDMVSNNPGSDTHVSEQCPLT